MRKRNVVLAAVGAAPAVALLISSCASAPMHSNLTVQCNENLTGGGDVTNGGVAGTGHCTITGLVHDSGPATDYRTQNGPTAYIRRVVAGARGTITFVITIDLGGGGGGNESWKITSATRAYKNLHGTGLQVVDNYQGTPATFELKGTVSRA